jgi:putative oxidoreductase
MTVIDLAVLILRLAVGLTFAAHGAQKAFGWWSGPGPEGWQAVMDRLGFRPTALFAGVSTAAELGGGLLLATGILTPLAVLVLVGHSVVIIAKAHWSHGFFSRDNGYEFALSLLAGAIAIGLIGPGAVSVDGLVGFAVSGEVRLGLIAIGFLGGFLTLAYSALTEAPSDAATQR